jgi:hypothetical protein
VVRTIADPSGVASGPAVRRVLADVAGTGEQSSAEETGIVVDVEHRVVGSEWIEHPAREEILERAPVRGGEHRANSAYPKFEYS